MKRFKQFIAEALNPDQKSKLGIYYNTAPSYAAKKISKDVIPSDASSIKIPLTHDTKSAVEQHLSKHGFQLKNYASGTAVDKYGREVGVASVLKSPKTAAPENVVKGFENDARADKISPDTHHIVFSHDPEHVGECSTNKPWKSCASLTAKGNPTSYGSGVAAKKLKDAISAGSHVAYLMKHDQDDLNKAHARVLLHPYHAYDKDGNIEHSVLMPERKVYSKTGGKQSSFTSSVEDFARKKYPMKPGRIYQKDSSVYDDDQQRIRFDTSPESVKKIALSGLKDGVSNSHKDQALKEVQLPHQSITALLNHKTDDDTERNNLDYTHGLIAEHQKLSDSHVSHLLKAGKISNLSRNVKLTKSQMNQMIYHKPTDRSDTLSPTDAELAQKHENRAIDTAHRSLVRNNPQKLTSDHIHHIIDRNNTETLNDLVSHPNLTDEHVLKMVHHIPTYYPETSESAVGANKRLDAMTAGIKDSVMEIHGRKLSDKQRQDLVNNPNTNADVLFHIARHTNSHNVLDNLERHPNLDEGGRAAVARRREDLN
jgi:hypothetical protein